MIENIGYDNMIPYEINKLIYAAENDFFDDEYTKFLIVCTKGLYFGYPKCCILHYYDNYSFENKKIKCDNICTKASGRTGFIPCYFHAKDIIEKRIRIGNLIDYNLRRTIIKFPRDPDITTCSINSKDFYEKEIEELYNLYMDN